MAPPLFHYIFHEYVIAMTSHECRGISNYRPLRTPSHQTFALLILFERNPHQISAVILVRYVHETYFLVATSQLLLKDALYSNHFRLYIFAFLSNILHSINHVSHPSHRSKMTATLIRAIQNPLFLKSFPKLSEFAVLILIRIVVVIVYKSGTHWYSECEQIGASKYYSDYQSLGTHSSDRRISLERCVIVEKESAVNNVAACTVMSIFGND